MFEPSASTASISPVSTSLEDVCGLFGRARRSVGDCRTDEVAEQRLRAQRARLEFRVVLRGDEERVLGELDRPRRGARPGDVPLKTRPLSSSRLRRWLLTS